MADLIARDRREHNVVPLDLSPRAERKVRPTRAALAMAASILLVSGLSMVSRYVLHSTPSYSTDVGEQRSLVLEDGSTVELNSRSRIRVAFNNTERSVHLMEGQALFHVARNPARPFVVHSGSARVRAVGTEFDVYRRATGTVVTVVEGRVAVLPVARNATDSAVLHDAQLAVENGKDVGSSHAQRANDRESGPTAGVEKTPVRSSSGVTQTADGNPT